MDRETEINLKKLILDKLATLWDEDDDNILGNFYFGENTVALMAEAAANIIIAGEEIRSYLKEQKIKP